MKAFFLSYFLAENTPCYGGVEGSVVFNRVRSISRGDNSNNLEVRFPNHTGTHIDFPFHFSNDGKTINDYDAGFWIFNKVGFLNCPIEKLPDHIDELPSDTELLILKTGFGAVRNERQYWAEQPVIPASFASLLRQKLPLLRVFGFDFISLTSQLNKSEGKQAHLAFLCENDILVLEDMNLIDLFTAPNKVLISPLMLAQADGAPCTIIAY